MDEAIILRTRAHRKIEDARSLRMYNIYVSHVLFCTLASESLGGGGRGGGKELEDIIVLSLRRVIDALALVCMQTSMHAEKAHAGKCSEFVSLQELLSPRRLSSYSFRGRASLLSIICGILCIACAMLSFCSCWREPFSSCGCGMLPGMS